MFYRVGMLLGAFLLGIGAVLVFWSGRASIPVDSPVLASHSQEEPAPAPEPARQLRIRAKAYSGDRKDLASPQAKTWEQAAPTQVLLNRTPRIYQTEEARLPTPPPLEVRALRTGERLMVRLVWQDATKDAPQAPPARSGNEGPVKLYKRPTGQTAAFADAAAIMMPERFRGREFPSLVMGDKRTPVLLFYWNASRGTEQLTATGRAAVSPSGKPFAHQAQHADGQWRVTMELPEVAPGCPLAFAVWDGNIGDRDGMKFFSVWYVLQGK